MRLCRAFRLPVRVSQFSPPLFLLSGYSPSSLSLALSFGSLDELAGAVEDCSDLLVGEAELCFEVSASYCTALCDICRNLVSEFRIRDLHLCRLARSLGSRAHRLESTFNEEVELVFSDGFEGDGVDSVVESHLVFSHDLSPFLILHIYFIMIF